MLLIVRSVASWNKTANGVITSELIRGSLSATMRGFAMGLGLRYSNCHVGEEGQVLAEAAQEEGSAAIRETYIALKEQYYGSHSYDFSEPGLGSLIRNWGRDENPAETTALLDLMLEEYPQSFQAHFMSGRCSARRARLKAQ